MGRARRAAIVLMATAALASCTAKGGAVPTTGSAGATGTPSSSTGPAPHTPSPTVSTSSPPPSTTAATTSRYPTLDALRPVLQRLGLRCGWPSAYPQDDAGIPPALMPNRTFECHGDDIHVSIADFDSTQQAQAMVTYMTDNAYGLCEQMRGIGIISSGRWVLMLAGDDASDGATGNPAQLRSIRELQPRIVKATGAELTLLRPEC